MPDIRQDNLGRLITDWAAGLVRVRMPATVGPADGPPPARIETPFRLLGRHWRQILPRVWRETSEDHVSLIAAGVAFYALLAAFPAITAIMALAGLVLEPLQVTVELQSLIAAMPKEASAVIIDQAIAVSGSQETGLGFAFLVSMGFAILSASSGTGSLIEGLNVSYDAEERRGAVLLWLWKLGLTALLIIGFLGGLCAVLALPVALAYLGLPEWLHLGLALIRWIILAAMTMTGIAVIYHFGPSRIGVKWIWVSPGAVLATAIWMVASIGFSIYVSQFGTYNQTFGSLAGVIVLLVWMWLSTFIILLGAELNAEIEAFARARRQGSVSDHGAERS